ncbi:MAG TPA: fluoride efflux transporter CrcB [Candidatus Omnitrophota bacterium]|nr:fluoride efflux transporter CrcB [Candidatus Omnitrophota bacterium]
MLGKIIAVSLGGVVGALMRYGTGGIVHRSFPADFPYGTLFINLAGCLAIGFLWGMFERFEFPSNARSFVFIGILGSFTTFSSYGIETFNLLRDGEINYGLMNILLNNVLGIVLVFAGFWLSRAVLGMFK